MSVLHVRQGEQPQQIVRLAGEYDLTRKDELTALFAELGGGGNIVIDMREVTYIDSTFLREIAALRLRDPQRTLSLLGVKPAIRRVLSIVEFDRLLDIA